MLHGSMTVGEMENISIPVLADVSSFRDYRKNKTIIWAGRVDTCICIYRYIYSIYLNMKMYTMCVYMCIYICIITYISLLIGIATEIG